MIEIVRQDFGPAAANSVARRIVMPAHRSGGQAQFLERPVRIRPDAEVAPVLDRIRLALHKPWTIDAMAREARMSKRTFERRFLEATGSSPGAWLIDERVEAAKHILSSSARPMEEVAEAVGVASAHALRHHFRRRVKLSPNEYRAEICRRTSASGVSFPVRAGRTAIVRSGPPPGLRRVGVRRRVAVSRAAGASPREATI